MAFWDDFLGGIVGKPARTVDPYAQDRMVKMDMLKRGMADYDRMMSTPGGAFPPAMRRQLQDESDERIAAANPGAGQSGFLLDRQARARNQINTDLAFKELDMLDKQRGYMAQLAGQAMPTQEMPAQPGMLQQGAGQLAGRATTALGDWIFGREKEPEDQQAKKNKQGGFAQFTNEPGG